MKKQDVVAVLGEPSDDHDGCLGYYDLGIALLPEKGGLLEFAVCSGGNAKFKPFAGHTKEGISIGSSRADVIKAYGEPTAIELGRGVPEHSLLDYKTRGIKFRVKEDKVYEIAVSLKP